MADVKNDIEKYLKGELSPAEMYALEKRALGDPFLAAALEGADFITPKDFLTDVAELNERVANQQKVKRPWMTPLKIAAGMALLIASSYFIYTFISPDEPVTLAENAPKKDKAQSPEKKTGDSASTPIKEKTEKDLLSLNQPAPSQSKRKEKAKKMLTTAKPVPVDEKAGPAEASSADSVQELAAAKATEPRLSEVVKTGREEESPKINNSDVAQQSAIRSHASAGSGNIQLQQRVIRGKITATEDDLPIPGASVIVKGTAQGAISDSDGNYQLITTAPNNDLIISSIGHQSIEATIPASQSEVNVQLQVERSPLNEVVVVDVNTKESKKDQTSPIQLAVPLGGHAAYNRYLEKKLRYPPRAIEKKIEGQVIIEFTVQPSGALSDYKIIQGVDFGCNEEAIRLAKEGPRWSPSSQDDSPVPSTARIQVKFKLPK